MQSNRARAAVLIAALAIAVGAFFVLRPSDDEQPPVRAGGQAAAGSGAEDSAPGAGADRRPRRPKPQVTTVAIEDGQPVGGVTEIEAEKGETIEFVVESDARDELHVHGYELTEAVAPNDPARFEFEADLEGIYEVEAHEAGDVPVAELRVSP